MLQKVFGKRGKSADFRPFRRSEKRGRHVLSKEVRCRPAGASLYICLAEDLVEELGLGDGSALGILTSAHSLRFVPEDRAEAAEIVVLRKSAGRAYVFPLPARALGLHVPAATITVPHKIDGDELTIDLSELAARE